MKEITINIANWGNVSDQEVLRAVRAVINNSVKYEQDRTIGRHYWHDPDKRVELQIIFK